MKKMIYLVSSFILFLNGTKVFSQNCDENNVDINLMSGFSTLNPNSHCDRTIIVEGIENEKFVIVGRDRSGSFDGSSPIAHIQKYDFDSANPSSSPLIDSDFSNAILNVSSSISNTYAQSQARLIDIDNYSSNTFATLASYDYSVNGKSCISLIDGDGLIRYFLFGLRKNEGVPNDIATDASKNRIYCSFTRGNEIIIRTFRPDGVHLTLCGSLTISLGINQTPQNTKLEFIPAIGENSEKLILSYNLPNQTGHLKIINCIPEIIDGPFIEDNEYDNTYDDGFFNTTLEVISDTYNLEGQVNTLEYNFINQRLYVAGRNMYNQSRIVYFDYNPDSTSLNLNTSFQSICSGYIHAFDFLSDCRIVIGGDITSDACSNHVGNSFVIDANTGGILQGPINIDGEIHDLVVYKTSNSTTFFAAGNQSQLTNQQHFTRYCIGTNESIEFTYCKKTNSDGSFTIVPSDDIEGVSFEYILNGEPITVDDLSNLTGTLKIIARTITDCGGSCFEETITSGISCNPTDKTTNPKNIKSFTNDAKKSNAVKNNVIVVSPNPSRGIFIIKGNLISNQNIEIDVYDLNSKLVFEKTISNFNNEGEIINLKDQESGTYIILITQGETKITQTIIKE